MYARTHPKAIGLKVNDSRSVDGATLCKPGVLLSVRPSVRLSYSPNGGCVKTAKLIIELFHYL